MLATGAPGISVAGSEALGQQIVADGTRIRPVHVPERDSPEEIELIAEFPSGLNILVTSSSVNEIGLNSMIRGHKATLYMGGNSVDLKPEKAFADDIEPQSFDHLEPSGQKIPEMEKNWFQAIRTVRAALLEILTLRCLGADGHIARRNVESHD